jgi:heme-degrading monooxygenase HmoA
MTFKPEGVDDFLENFHANKNSIRNSPGCLHLELWQDENDATIFLTHSHWKSEKYLNQYRDSELFKSVWSYTKKLFADRPIAFSSKKIEEVGK